MLDYLKLIFIFLLFFISINAEVNGLAPPTFGYIFCAVVLIFGFLAYRRYKTRYVRSMYLVSVTVQVLFCLAIPYWLLHSTMALNASWPYFPEVLWATGSLVVAYYIISFVFLPIIVYLYGRRAWCSFICGTGTLAETLGDKYRTKGSKAGEIPRAFTVIKWIILLGSIIITVFALTNGQDSKVFNLVFLVVFILLLRTLLMQAVNIILMPKLGTRVWCKYFCPQGLLLEIISKRGRFALVRDDTVCAGCKTCNQHCSMSIDIAGGAPINRSGDCVGCGICVEVCPQNALSMVTDTPVAPGVGKVPGQVNAD